jgi:large subunit ribosomal protein L30
MKRVKVTQLRAALDEKQALALRGLGLRRIRHTVDVVDTPSARGLILKVRHLVTVQEGEARDGQERRRAEASGGGAPRASKR